MSWRRWRVLSMSWSTSSLQPWPSMLFLKRCKIDRQRTPALLFFPSGQTIGYAFRMWVFAPRYTIEGYAPLLESEALYSACLPSLGLVAFVYPSWLPVAMSCRSVRSARKCVSETNGLGAEARMSFHGVGNGCGGRPRLRFDNS